MHNKRNIIAAKSDSTDPYKLGYSAGFAGKQHSLNPYPKNIPDSFYNSRNDHLRTFLNTPDLDPHIGSSGVTDYHLWFSGWNDGMDARDAAA